MVCLVCNCCFNQTTFVLQHKINTGSAGWVNSCNFALQFKTFEVGLCGLNVNS